VKVSTYCAAVPASTLCGPEVFEIEKSPFAPAAVLNVTAAAWVIEVCVDIPGVHFVAPRHHRHLAAINRASTGRRSVRWTCSYGQIGTGLIGEPCPLTPVGGGIKSVQTDCRQKFSSHRVIDHRTDGTRIGRVGAVGYVGVGPRDSAVRGVINSTIHSHRIF
jgi:hypothetical protein